MFLVYFFYFLLAFVNPNAMDYIVFLRYDLIQQISPFLMYLLIFLNMFDVVFDIIIT